MLFYSENTCLQAGVLLVILTIATIWDIRTKKIPNLLILSGLIGGFLRMSSVNSVIWAIIFLVILLLFSSLRLIGNGDIKLWMVISLFTGILGSCIIMLFAVGLFFLYGLIRYKKAALHIYITSFTNLATKQGIKRYTGIEIPFAPFMLAGYILYLFI